MDNFKVKAKYNVNDVEKLIKRLCDDVDGCPWDKVQTHESIRKNFLEEVYEACDAIDKKDTELLKEELGDVLLQVVLHSEFERKKGEFSLDDVADGVCKKLVHRHPHIFSGVEANDSENVLQNWEAIKRKEKSQTTGTQSIKDVPRALPILARSQKVQKRAAYVGYDFNDVSEAVEAFDLSIAKLKQQLSEKTDVETAIGEVVFKAVAIARLSGVDAEQAVEKTCEKFIKDFETSEQNALEQGTKFSKSNIDIY